MALKNSDDTIGNRTRDLPVRSVVLIHNVPVTYYVFITYPILCLV